MGEVVKDPGLFERVTHEWRALREERDAALVRAEKLAAELDEVQQRLRVAESVVRRVDLREPGCVLTQRDALFLHDQQAEVNFGRVGGGSCVTIQSRGGPRVSGRDLREAIERHPSYPKPKVPA